MNVVLSGEELPEGLEQRSGIVLDTHSGRFATMALDADGLAWLAAQDTVEWIEGRPVFELMNSKGIDVMNVLDTWTTTNMSAIDSSWSGLNGSGIIVTVADTGLDNGVNNSNMHPDFRDHITGILSFPPSASVCSYYNLNPCGDDAEDHDGHGTHVAGSVLGDGTHSNGDIIGAAPKPTCFSTPSPPPTTAKRNSSASPTTSPTCLNSHGKTTAESTPTHGAQPLTAPTPPRRCKPTLALEPWTNS